MGNKSTKLFIFATSSQRRIDLIKNIYLNKIIFVQHCFDEKKFEIKNIKQLRILARKKAESIEKKYVDAVIISADTAVFCGGRFLGKPLEQQEAKKHLKMISGKNVLVATAVFIKDLKSNKKTSFVEKTIVKFRKLSKEEINWYISTNEWKSKAGSFAIQGKGKVFIEKIFGDYFNVVGIPICRLTKELRKFGLDYSYDKRTV